MSFDKKLERWKLMLYLTD